MHVALVRDSGSVNALNNEFFELLRAELREVLPIHCRPANDDFALRNLTTKEFVRMRRREPECDSVGLNTWADVVLMYSHDPDEAVPSILKDILFCGTHWSSEDDIVPCGAWAGHALDVVSFDIFQDVLSSEELEWKDISSIVAQEVTLLRDMTI